MARGDPRRVGGCQRTCEQHLLGAAWHVLSNGVPYEDLGVDWLEKRRPETHVRRLTRQIEALGYSVSVELTEAA